MDIYIFKFTKLPASLIVFSKNNFDRKVRAMKLLWWNIWWRTRTSIGIFWLASDFSNLPNLVKPTKDKTCNRRLEQLLNFLKRNSETYFDLHGFHCNIPSLDYTALPQLK